MSEAAGKQESALDRSDHHKHMDYVQAAINRLANNSFVMKGWALTVSSTLLGFAVSRGEPLLAMVAVTPALAFWVLDAYFLRQEKAFRAMYDDVAAMKVKGFEIKPAPYAARQPWSVVFSISLTLFYGFIILVSIVIVTTLTIPSKAASGTDSGTFPCVHFEDTPHAHTHIHGCIGKSPQLTPSHLCVTHALDD